MEKSAVKLSLRQRKELQRKTENWEVDLSQEEWRPVLGYDGKYEVSNIGRIRSVYFFNRSGVKTKRIFIRKYRTDQQGYPTTTFSSERRHIHVLVLEAFIGKRPDGFVCCHLNGLPFDNRVENLKWGTHKENYDHRIIHGGGNSGSRNGRWKGGISNTYKYRLKNR